MDKLTFQILSWIITWTMGIYGWCFFDTIDTWWALASQVMCVLLIVYGCGALTCVSDYIKEEKNNGCP